MNRSLKIVLLVKYFFVFLSDERNERELRLDINFIKVGFASRSLLNVKKLRHLKHALKFECSGFREHSQKLLIT